MSKIEITNITKKVSAPAVLPDGVYKGEWGGSVIAVTFEGEEYILTTSEGVRTFGLKVIVTVEDGKATFTELNN